MSNSYIIENTAGTLKFVIEQGTLNGPGGVDRDSDLFLYGQGAIQWGEGVTTNLIRIAESSACPEKEPTDLGYVAGSPRPKDQIDLGSIKLGITTPLNGQLWYNTTQKAIYTYDIVNDEWRSGSGLYIDTDPLTPVVGDFKYDSNFHGAGVSQLLIYDGTSFISTAQEYTRLAGDTMTGLLTLSADPVDPLHAVTKQFADTTYVDVAGDTMTGLLTLSADPVNNLHAVTKQYADTTFVDAAGDTMSGPLDMGANEINNVTDPSLAQDAATKNYVDVAVAAVNAVFSTLFKVGSLFFGPDPNGTIPGTWTQLPVGTFLMAAGAGDNAGAVGGTNNPTLTNNEVPAHDHTGNTNPDNHFHYIASSGGANGGTPIRDWKNNFIAYDGGPNSSNREYRLTTRSGLGQPNSGRTSESVSTQTFTTGNSGDGNAYDSRPQYEAADVWKRTS